MWACELLEIVMTVSSTISPRFSSKLEVVANPGLDRNHLSSDMLGCGQKVEVVVFVLLAFILMLWAS